MPLPYLPLLIALGGLVLYAATEGKPSEIGRVMFFAGLLAYLLKGMG